MHIDRHHVKCSSDNAISMLRLQKSGPNIRYQYNCCSKKIPGCTLKRKFTKFSSNGGGKLNIFNKHKLNCGPDGYISQFNIERNQPRNQFRYEYYCCIPRLKKGKPKCYSSRTPFSDSGNEKIYYLDRHVISCHIGYALTSFVMEKKSNGKRIRYHYSCCAFN